MASTSFGSERRPAGPAFRKGDLGRALDEVYRDVEAAFAAIEANAGVTLLKTIVNAASNTYTVAAPVGMTLVEVVVSKISAVEGNTASSVKIMKGGADITDDMSIQNFAVGDLVRPTKLANASAVFAKGDNITISVTRGVGGNAGVSVALIGVRS